MAYPSFSANLVAGLPDIWTASSGPSSSGVTDIWTGGGSTFGGHHCSQVVKERSGSLGTGNSLVEPPSLAVHGCLSARGVGSCAYARARGAQVGMHLRAAGRDGRAAG